MFPSRLRVSSLQPDQSDRKKQSAARKLLHDKDDIAGRADEQLSFIKHQLRRSLGRNHLMKAKEKPGLMPESHRIIA
jgi:hypothetical protein